MKISFILPVYKVEAYLRECVESLTCQTYKDFEIILVDDGSPDGCPALCEQLATEDNRIKVLHKSNGGLSDARNYGLAHALGEYVIFVDSDDFWQHNNSLQKLIEVLDQGNIDVICFNSSYYYEDTDTYRDCAPFPDRVLSPCTPSEFLIEMQKVGTLPMSAWSKVCRRTFLIENNISFIKGLIHEDTPWMIDILDKAKKIKLINEYIYAYRQNRIGSITNTIRIEKNDSLARILKYETDSIELRSFTYDGKMALKSFLASLVCQRIPTISMIKNKEDKAMMKASVEPYLYLLQFDMNPKVRLTNIIYKVFGFTLTSKILYIYMKWRSHKR